MATIFIDGFDKYGPTGENSPLPTALAILSEYLAFSIGGGTGTVQVVAPLSGTGFALQLAGGNGGCVLTKTLPTNYSRIIGGFRFQCNLVQICGIEFNDLGSYQFSIFINTTGTIKICTGSNGTAIATSTASISANSTHYLEWDVTIGTSAAFNVYLDGVSIASGSTGNTRGGTTTNQVNGYRFNSVATGGTLIVDDFYLFDTSGTTNNAVLNTNPRIETRFPSSDSQTQWTNGGNVLVPVGITQTGVSNLTGTTNAPGANQLVLLKVTPAVTCSLQSVGILPQASSTTVNFKSVLYTDSAGSPNTLVATGTQVTGSTAGSALALPFSGGQSLTGGTSYWIGYITDTSIVLAQYDATTNRGQRAANTFGSGAPGTAPAMTSGQPTWEIWGNATGATTNWSSVAANPYNSQGPSGDSAAITSSTSGNEDLYSFPALTTTATAVYTVAVKAAAKKAAGGLRTVDLRLKSSATDSAGSNAGQTPGDSFAILASYFDKDPNGNVAWTSAAANAATAGPKIAS